MTFPPLGVKILQHEIFTPVHCGKHIIALNFHLLGWSKNIIASNIDLFQVSIGEIRLTWAIVEPDSAIF